MDKNKTRLTVIADTHYYSRSLGCEGRAYTLRSESDQKCLAETSEIIDAAFKKIAQSDTDAVLIAGDLTNDGEMICHKEFREKLNWLKKFKPVFVVTATHDFCCDQNPRRFEGDKVYNDVETMPPDKLRDFYYEYGPESASAEFFTHLGTSSYAVDFTDRLRLLCFNDDQSGNGGSGFSEEHFKWIEAQLTDAKSKNMMVISMEHHLLVKHVHPLITSGGVSVKDEESVASRLADAGLKYSFVGHSHMTDIAEFTSPSGNKLYSVNVGSLCGYPAPIANVTVNFDTDSITVDFDYLKEFEGVPDAELFLKQHATNIFEKVIKGIAYGDKKEFTDRINALNAPGEQISKFRPLIRPAAKFLDKLTVKKAYNIFNSITFGKRIDKNWIQNYKDMLVMEIAESVFLSILDGSRKRFSPDSDYYKFVMSVVSLPSDIFKNNKLYKQFKELVDIVLRGNSLNNFPTEL